MFFIVAPVAAGIGGALGWLFTKTRSVEIDNNSDTLITVQCLNPTDHQNGWGPEKRIEVGSQRTVLEEAIWNNRRPDLRIRYFVENEMVHEEIKSSDEIDRLGQSHLSVSGNHGVEYRNRQQGNRAQREDQQTRLNALLDRCTAGDNRIADYQNRISLINNGTGNDQVVRDVQYHIRAATDRIREVRTALGPANSMNDSNIVNRVTNLFGQMDESLRQAENILRSEMQPRQQALDARRQELRGNIEELRVLIQTINTSMNADGVVTTARNFTAINTHCSDAENALMQAGTALDDATLANRNQNFQQAEQHIVQARELITRAQRILNEVQGVRQSNDHTYESSAPRVGLFGSRVTQSTTNEHTQVPRL